MLVFLTKKKATRSAAYALFNRARSPSSLYRMNHLLRSNFVHQSQKSRRLDTQQHWESIEIVAKAENVLTVLQIVLRCVVERLLSLKFLVTPVASFKME